MGVLERLETAADPDGILISHETYTHAKDIITVKERDSIAMKGINRDIKVLVIQGRRSSNQENLNVKSNSRLNATHYDTKKDTAGAIERINDQVAFLTQKLVKLEIQLGQIKQTNKK